MFRTMISLTTRQEMYLSLPFRLLFVFQACHHVGGLKPSKKKKKKACDDADAAVTRRGFPRHEPKGVLLRGMSFSYKEEHNN